MVLQARSFIRSAAKKAHQMIKSSNTINKVTLRVSKNYKKLSKWQELRVFLNCHNILTMESLHSELTGSALRLNQLSILKYTCWTYKWQKYYTIDFSLNELNHEKIKKNSTVTKGITYLATGIFPAIVIKSTFYILPFGRTLLPWSQLNRTLHRCSNKTIFLQLHLGIYILLEIENIR